MPENWDFKYRQNGARTDLEGRRTPYIVGTQHFIFQGIRIRERHIVLFADAMQALGIKVFYHFYNNA